jgi:hypothetical protein
VRLLSVEQHTEGSESMLRLRYTFVGHLDPIAKLLLGGVQLPWRQELRLGWTSHDGGLSFEAEADPSGSTEPATSPCGPTTGAAQYAESTASSW